MIKIRATLRGSDVVILGLTSENWKRLQANQPIMFDAAQLGITEVDKVIIIGGENEAELGDDLQSIGINVPLGPPEKH